MRAGAGTGVWRMALRTLQGVGVVAGTMAGGMLATGGPAGAAETPAAVQVAYRDLDGDGVDEIVLENEFLSVELMTGVLPAVAPTSPKYGTRFVWAGWIHNITYKPTSRRWFLDDPTPNHWQGIPEEFEEAVRMRETAPGEFDVLKLGIGVCRGTGICHHGSLKIVRTAPWTHEVVASPAGGRSVRFRQVLAEGGYGYEYGIVVGLEPGQSCVSVLHRLRNAGTEPLRSSWYTHAFWAQAAGGQAYDAECWTTIPFRFAEKGALAGVVDTEPCPLVNPAPHGFWGAVPGERIPESWSAAGNRATGDVFLTRLDVPLAWDRVWTFPTVYSCEPFTAFEVAPGAVREWTVWRQVGNGLRRVRGMGPAGALDWSLVPTAADPAKTDLLVSFLPDRPRRDVELSVTVAPAAGSASAATPAVLRIGACDPGVVGSGRLGPFAAGLNRVRVVARQGADVLADVTRVSGPPAALPSTQFPALRAPVQALVLTDMPAGAGGQAQPSRAGAFLVEYLKPAGFVVTVADPNSVAQPVPAWNDSRVVIVAGLTKVPAYLRGWLEAHVQAGNGLLYGGPLVLGGFEFSALLPVRHVLGQLDLSGCVTRDGTREFVDASLGRWQLAPVAEHPILAGLPFYPDAYQDVTSLQVVEARAGAQVLLRYEAGAACPVKVSSPALVVGAFGRGRVAVLASPVDWGLPPGWVIWCRLAEYHRRFVLQTALWAAGEL